MCPLSLFFPSGVQNAEGIAERIPSTERAVAAVFLTKFFIEPFPFFLTYYVIHFNTIFLICQHFVKIF